MASPSWIRNAVTEALGFRGRTNIMAWVVAGSLAYVFYVVPERKRAEEQHAARELARQLAAQKGLVEIDRATPIPDPQDTGLVKGSKNASSTSSSPSS